MLAGAVLLVLGTGSTVVEIKVLTTTEIAAPIDTVLSGWERHGPALVILGGLAVLMAIGALRGSRPAAIAVAVVGAVTLVLVVARDVPALDDTRGVEELYEGVEAGPKDGFYLETGGAVLVLLGGAALTLFGPRRAT